MKTENTSSLTEKQILAMAEQKEAVANFKSAVKKLKGISFGVGGVVDNKGPLVLRDKAGNVVATIPVKWDQSVTFI